MSLLVKTWNHHLYWVSRWPLLLKTCNSNEKSTYVVFCPLLGWLEKHSWLWRWNIKERKTLRLLFSGGAAADWPLCRRPIGKAFAKLLPLSQWCSITPPECFVLQDPCFNGYIPLTRPADVSPDPLFLPKRKSWPDFPITAFYSLAFLLPEMEAPCLVCVVNICIIQ